MSTQVPDTDMPIPRKETDNLINLDCDDNNNNTNNMKMSIDEDLAIISGPKFSNHSDNSSTNSSRSSGVGTINSAPTSPRSTSAKNIIKVIVTQPMIPIDPKHVMYEVNVHSTDKSWTLYKRYSEFLKLYDMVKKKKKSISNLSIKLPPKRFFGNNFDQELIRTRTVGLNDLMAKLVSDPEIRELDELRAFLQLEKLHPLSKGKNSLGESESSDEDRMDTTGDHLTMTSVASSNGSTPKLLFKLGSSEKDSATANDFDFLKVIGKGSFGKVLLARHKKEDKVYAVKVLSKKMILKRNEKAHIMCERSVLVKNHHPFLVSLQYSFQSRDKLYFVMDYVNGGELFFHLQKEKYFPESRARFYAAEIVSALGYLHSIGIIYRDLKPENILLDSTGHIVLTDFGLCKDGLTEGRDTTNTFCGTPEYLAPEVLRKEHYDKTVDWWCLGAVLYEMIYGLPPFYSRDTSEMYENILQKPLRTKGNISLAARDLLEKLLEKDKKKRLGVRRDADEIKEHDFFRTIDWTDLETKRIPPPFNPNVKGDLDLKNIDSEFTREPIPPSISRSGGIGPSSIPINAFEGFSYAAHPSHMN